MPHGFWVPDRRADKSWGLYGTGSGIVTLLTYLVGLVSTETTGLTPLDSSTSFAQSSGMGVQFVGSSLVGCASVHSSPMVSSFVSPLA